MGLGYNRPMGENRDSAQQQQTRILPACSESQVADSVAAAAALLRAGRLVAFPTETVYGLGADATDDRAVAGIFAAKDRPRINPLIVHVTDREAAARHVVFSAQAAAVAERFWPGPLTLVLPRRADCPVSRLCSAGLESLAVRVPDHALAQALLRAVALPLAAPSANPSGRVSPTTAAHVAKALFGRIAAVLDGGPCRVGVESTVLDLSGPEPRLLRQGGLAQEDLEAVLGPIAAPVRSEGGDESLPSPGLLASHYAPALPLRLAVAAPRPDEALLAFGAAAPAGAAVTVNLSPAGDLIEAAARLFAALHDLDRPDYAGIAVVPLPEVGLGRAINDRLRRAAAPRPAATANRQAQKVATQ